MTSSKNKNPRIQHLVPNNPQADRQLTGGNDWDAKAEADAKKNTLYDSSYKTASGHWKDRDEPGEPKRTEYLKIAPDALKKHQQWVARQRLKKKNAVPSKQGKKLFDEFMKEASACRPQQINASTTISAQRIHELQNLYNAAHALEFSKWLIFIGESQLMRP